MITNTYKPVISLQSPNQVRGKLSVFSKAKRLKLTVIVLLLILLASCNSHKADLIVYGCTSAGISAAVEAKRQGMSVIVVGPDIHLGGLTASGLGWTDSGNKSVVGGFAREYYQRIKAIYDLPDTWVFESPEECRHYKPEQDAVWVFEPHVAEQVFEDLVEEYDIPVFRDSWLDRSAGVVKNEGVI